MSTSATSIGMPYIYTSVQYPNDMDELTTVLTKTHIDIANCINRRTIGIFNTIQVVTGDQYYSLSNTSIRNPIQYRQSYRKLFPFGAIAAGATLLIPHGITGITEIVHLYGNCITDVSVMALATAKYEPIPFVSATDVTQQVQLFMDDTNITIINGAGNNNILSGTIIIEYLLN